MNETWKTYRETKDEKARIGPLTVGQGIAIAAAWMSAFAMQGWMYWLEHLDPTDWDSMEPEGWVDAIGVFLIVAAFHFPLIVAWMLSKRIARQHWED